MGASINEVLEQLRLEREQLDDKLADRVLELLDEHGLGELVRRRLSGAPAPAPERAKTVVVRAAAARVAAKPAPKASANKKGGRINFAGMPGFGAWCAKLVAPVLELEKGTPERARATAKLFGPLKLPNGETRALTKTVVYAWINKLEAQRGRSGKATKASKAPAPASDDEDEPVEARPLGACSVPGCTKPTWGGNDLCRSHYASKRQYADAEAGRPADDSSERERLQQAGTIGNPVELLKDYDDPSRRQTACPAYNGCLSFVIGKKWAAWACVGCKGPGLQQPSREADGGGRRVSGRSAQRALGGHSQ